MQVSVLVQSIFIAGRISNYFHNWQKLKKWSLDIVKGYKIELNKIPMQLSHRPTNITKDQTKVLDKLIKSFEYLEKGIIRRSQMIIMMVNFL